MTLSSIPTWLIITIIATGFLLLQVAAALLAGWLARKRCRLWADLDSSTRPRPYGKPLP